MSARLLGTILIALAMSVSAVAADDKDSKKEEKTIDYASMSTPKLRKHMDKAAEDFYDAFNELNDEDDFMVRCDYVRPTGSRRKLHQCTAKFIEKAQTEHAERNWKNKLEVSGNNVETELESKGVEFDKKITTLVNENPELAQKLSHYNSLVTMVAERSKK